MYSLGNAGFSSEYMYTKTYLKTKLSMEAASLFTNRPLMPPNIKAYILQALTLKLT